MWTCTWPLLTSHERLPSHLYILFCGTHPRHAKHICHAGNTSKTLARICTLLRIEIRSRVSALVLNMLGCNLQWIQRGCRLDQQELAVSRLGLQAVYCPNSACTSAYRDIKILVLTDCIRGLHCVTHVWYVHSMYYMYIYICVTDYIRAVSENFNALRKRTSTCIYGYLLRRARHSSMCPTCDQPPAQYRPFHCTVLSQMQISAQACKQDN